MVTAKRGIPDTEAAIRLATGSSVLPVWAIGELSFHAITDDTLYMCADRGR